MGKNKEIFFKKIKLKKTAIIKKIKKIEKK